MRPTYLLTACLSLFLACQKPEQPPASKTEVPNVIEDTTGDNMLIGTWLRDGGVYGIVDSSGDTVYVDDTQNWLQCVWDDEYIYTILKKDRTGNPLSGLVDLISDYGRQKHTILQESSYTYWEE